MSRSPGPFPRAYRGQLLWLIPVVGYLVAGDVRWRAPLESLRGWLVHNNATVMAVLLLVIGVVVIGKGISSFKPSFDIRRTP